MWLYAPPAPAPAPPIAFSFGGFVLIFAEATDGLMVAVVEDVVVLGAVGRRFAGEGGLKKGESSGVSSDEGRAPSNVAVSMRSWLLLGPGDKGAEGRTVDVDGDLAANTSSFWLAMLNGREGDAGMLRLLDGLANGLVGRSSDWLIWLGRRANGLIFSGDRLLVGRLFVLSGESDGAAFVGEDTGDALLRVLFCRWKGDCRPIADIRFGVEDCDADQNTLVLFAVMSTHTMMKGRYVRVIYRMQGDDVNNRSQQTPDSLGSALPASECRGSKVHGPGP
jgi:hypothetical protein